MTRKPALFVTASNASGTLSRKVPMVFTKQHLVVALASVTVLLSGCATEASKSLPVQAVSIAQTPYAGKPVAVAVGKFDNRSSYMRGLFSDGVDRVGSQAKTILVTTLQQSRRFSVLDRENMNETKQEAAIANKQQALKAANYVITGDVTEFGRKEVGDRELFGILGSGKSQVAYAKVSLNIVDASTSEVVASSQGAGEYSLSNREIIGFGGTASYDSTLNGKVLDLAIQEAVNHLSEQVDAGALRASK
ncbi:CsgG/HfaB family protein [Caballeronia sp. HLA56]